MRTGFKNGFWRVLWAMKVVISCGRRILRLQIPASHLQVMQIPFPDPVSKKQLSEQMQATIRPINDTASKCLLL
jgi:hypothetical protein